MKTNCLILTFSDRNELVHHALHCRCHLFDRPGFTDDEMHSQLTK
jgi:hypothetical protein